MQAHASARIIISRNIPDKCGPNAGARARVLALGRTRSLHNNNQMKYVRMMGLWWLNGGDSLCPGARFGAERCVCVCVRMRIVITLLLWPRVLLWCAHLAQCAPVAR